MMEREEIGMELEVEGNQRLDPRFIKPRDILSFRAEGKEFVHRVGERLVTTWTLSDSEAIHKTYPIHNGVISLNDFKSERYNKTTRMYENINGKLGEILT